jgi:hypothetical protein
VQETEDAYRVLVARHEGKKYLENMGLNGRIILKRIFKNWDWDVD